MKKIFALVFALAIVASVIAACASSTGGTAMPQAPAGTLLRKIQDRGKLIVGVKYDLPTFGYLNPKTNQMEGFDPAIARAIAESIFGDPNKVEFKEAVTKDRIPFLKDGTVDLVIGTFIITEERLKEVDFSIVYYTTGGRLLVAKDSPIRSVADLNGKKVGTPQGSVYVTELPKVSKAQVMQFKNDSAALEALLQKQVDATTNNDANLYGLALLNPGVKVVGLTYTRESFGVGMAKGNPELMDAVNTVIKSIKASGKWKQIWKQEIGDKLGMTSIPEPPADGWKK